MLSCDKCGKKAVDDALFCPRCLESHARVNDKWFPVDESGSDNPVAQHDLVPEHRILPEQKVEALLHEYDISRTDLPKIKISDPAIEHLQVSAGDIIKIVRDSRTTNHAVNYRLVVSPSGGQAETTKEWRNPAEPSSGVYNFTDRVTGEQAQHILENIRAHVPPSEPGTCSRIAVGRETKIETAVTRALSSKPYTFIQGELGFGKSFFLYWIRDEVFPSSAVSIVDLNGDASFTNLDTLVRAFRDRLETPRSVTNTEYANGLDELWDTFLRQVSDLCASHYEREGYEVRSDRMSESIKRATESLLSETEIAADIQSRLVKVAEDHFDTPHQSLSQSLLDDVADDSALDYVRLIATMAQLNGYRLILAIDELEKANRSPDHFESIFDFVQSLPDNTSLIVTGTPELVEGGKKGNALRESCRNLYELTVKHRIVLERPTQDDLAAFTDQLLSLEEKCLPKSQREYSTAVGKLGSTTAAADKFVQKQPPTFRGYLEFLEDIRK